MSKIRYMGTHRLAYCIGRRGIETQPNGRLALRLVNLGFFINCRIYIA